MVRNALVSLFGELDDDPAIKTGKRRWDPVKYPEPWVYLMLVVKTDLNNLSVCKENQPAVRDCHDDLLVTGDAEAQLIEAEVDAERERRTQRTYSLLIDELGDDNELILLHDLMMQEGITKPEELAARLNMSIKDVNNLKKRMSRAAQRAMARFEKERADA